MTNRLYPKGAEKLFSGAFNFSSDTLKVALLPSGYVYSATHEFLSDLGTRVGTDQVLADKSIAGGTFDAADSVFGAIAAGSTVAALVIYKDTGNASTSPLIALFDQVTGFPFATNGGEVTVPWSNSAAKIISLVS